MDTSDMSQLMSMSGSGGMDMGSSDIFRPHNQSLARTYWYIIAACVLFGGLLRIVSVFEAWSRRRRCRKLNLAYPTRPRNFVSQAYATVIAIARELSYPQVLQLSHSHWSWLSPPPLGQCLFILTYWVAITLFLTTGSILNDAYYWERIAFRAAWISVTQVPFVFLLAGKINILSLLFGPSYIDIIWLHKWASRTLFVTVTVHGAFFIREWTRADFFALELQMMPMVRYGLGLWGVLAWTMITSIVPLRSWCYEFFVIQHIVSAAIFLWLLHAHVPSYAAYNIWLAIAFGLSGRVYQSCLLVYRNVGGQRATLRRLVDAHLGHPMEYQALPGDITKVTISNVRFHWRAGQHILLWCPRLGFFETHPFTIANTSRTGKESSNRVELIVRARSGFTRRLYRRALSSNAISSTMTAFLTGPLGNMPAWNTVESLVLISASTGASFTLPILESVLGEPRCVRRIDCWLLVRDKSYLKGYLPRLISTLSLGKESGVSLRIRVCVTGRKDENKCQADCSEDADSQQSDRPGEISSNVSVDMPPQVNGHASLESVSSSSKDGVAGEKKPLNATTIMTSKLGNDLEKTDSLQYIHGRPNLADIIRKPVEASGGETSVVICGGRSLTSIVRNCVSSLSDERAVHKGTGAQGIHLHVEGFGS